MKLSWPFPGWSPWRVLFGIFLMLIAGPIGDTNDFLGQAVFPSFYVGSGDKYHHPYQYDRLAGCVILVWGWCQIARGLGAGRKLAIAKPNWLQRLRHRLHYLPVPVLGTLALVLLLGYPRASRQVLTIEVSNVSPGTTLRVAPRRARHPLINSRYIETFDYLFFIVPFSDSGSPEPRATGHASSEYNLDGSPFSLVEWRPQWDWILVSAYDEDRHMGEFITIRTYVCDDCSTNIEVNRQSLGPCRPQGGYDSVAHKTYLYGTCLVQSIDYPRGSKQVHMSIDLSHIEPTVYTEQLQALVLSPE